MMTILTTPALLAVGLMQLFAEARRQRTTRLGRHDRLVLHPVQTRIHSIGRQQ